MNAARRRHGRARLAAWLRATAFTLGLALLTAWGVGDDGRVMPAVVVGAAALGLGFLYWLFPRGLNFAFGTATGLAIYASLFVVLSQAQFPQALPWSRAPAFLLPILAFLSMAWWRRRELAAVVGREDEGELARFSHSLRWLMYTALVGVICFTLPINRLEPWAQAVALLLAMGTIAGIVALAVREVVRLLVDVALVMHEISDRARHLVMPATAFLLMYALLVIVFAACYRIADSLSIVPLFNSATGPLHISYSDALHFSIATLSTVGYGDIHPMDDGIRVLASLQVVAGQLLLLFGVAEIMRARRTRAATEHDLDHEGKDGHSPHGS